MQPPSGGSYPGPQGPYDPQGQPPSGSEPPQYGYPPGQNPGYPPQGGSYPGGYYPQQGAPQQGYQPGGYPTGPAYPGPGGPGGYGYPPPPRGVASRGWFWITLAAVVVIVAGVITTIIVTSGGDGKTPVGQGSGGPSTSSQTDSSAPIDSGSPTGSSRSSDTGSPGSTSTSTGGDLGRTFNANGIESGEKVSVTLVAVDQNARSTDTYEQPKAGMHYVATEVRIRNIGSVKYDDAVNNDIAVYDDENSRYSISYVETISSGTVFDDVSLAPGQSVEGWSVYEMPIGKTIHSVTFTPDSAIAHTTVQWKLG